MVVVVPLAAPDYSLPVAQEVAVDAWVVDVFLFLFFDKGAYGGVLRRHLQYSVDLVTALIVLECDTLTVGVPLRSGDPILASEQFGGGDKRPRGLDFEDAWDAEGQLVARLGILLTMEPGLQLVAWRRFYVVDKALLSRAYAYGSSCPCGVFRMYQKKLVFPTQCGSTPLW